LFGVAGLALVKLSARRPRHASSTFNVGALRRKKLGLYRFLDFHVSDSLLMSVEIDIYSKNRRMQTDIEEIALWMLVLHCKT
jgi:hypothetical protein